MRWRNRKEGGQAAIYPVRPGYAQACVKVQVRKTAKHVIAMAPAPVAKVRNDEVTRATVRHGVPPVAGPLR